MTNANTKAVAGSNVSGISDEVLKIFAEDQKAKSGPLKLIRDFPNEIQSLSDSILLALNSKAVSPASIAKNFFAAQPSGEKLLEQYERLSGRNANTLNKKLKRDELKVQIKGVEQLLIRTATTQRVLNEFANSKFKIDIKVPANTGNRLCAFIHGLNDKPEDALKFSVAALMVMDGVDLRGISAIADVPTSSGKRKGASNTNGSNANGEAIAPSKVSEAINALDTTLAQYDISKKDNGLPPNAVNWYSRLWAHLDSVLTPAQKAEALKQFNADAMPEKHDEAAAS
jgi:hypothetical protein